MCKCQAKRKKGNKLSILCLMVLSDRFSKTSQVDLWFWSLTQHYHRLSSQLCVKPGGHKGHRNLDEEG